MKLFSLYFSVYATAVCGQSVYEADWKSYKMKHNKIYSKGEDDVRNAIFLARDKQLKLHNSQGHSYQLEHNKFSDLSHEELTRYLGLNASLAPSARFLQSFNVQFENRALPTSLYYHNDTCMPPVKDQGGCGSCWAFAAVAPLEFAQCKNKTKSVVLLSEQQLVDCVQIAGSCTGGWYTDAWDYLIAAKGSAKQSFYPYTGVQGTCKYCPGCACMIGAKVFTYGYVPSNNATAMQIALQKYGPLAVAIAAVNPFFSYSSGVYTDTTCDKADLNHGVVVVGWGILSRVKYWIVRNSWGPGWGLKGYILIQRGVNKCKMELYPAYVVPAS
ncbi:hypothetical protein DAPPUDRAFT_312319 [Daphnia pulex]|uniref:Peptidase C1A papain C-terminal domain-containing protein n=1 Tax=Daphnia pulex TaxID=6669 RepID=E9G0G3_DAPPU|nr:hypothetical protein DAPPUDRAFT_312319 [Daphnia pulex]|eukprot:EFX87410.1 hypothetical protein DAPPUDRAFT_312319 [Daphnia pulex]